MNIILKAIIIILSLIFLYFVFDKMYELFKNTKNMKTNKFLYLAVMYSALLLVFYIFAEVWNL